MRKEHAERFTEGLGKVLEGAVDLADLGSELYIPQALGLKPEDWYQHRLMGPVKLTREDRRKASRALTAPKEDGGAGLSNRQAADVLGVSKDAVARDLGRDESGSYEPPGALQNADSGSGSGSYEPLPRDKPASGVVERSVEAPRSRGQLANQSGGDEAWATPPDLFAELDAEFGLRTDVCATASDTKCAVYFSPEDDGLAQDWRSEDGPFWMNPPYGDGIWAWVLKAREAGAAGAVVVCLLPARVDTGWWHDNCPQGEMRFLRGRIKFGGQGNSAPFPSAVVVFGPGVQAGAVRWWKRG